MPTIARQAPRILLVDDHAELLENLQAWLQCAGYEALIASNGHQALALARSEAFDLVVTDLAMPGVNGLQLMDLLREIDDAVPVIVLTGIARRLRRRTSRLARNRCRTPSRGEAVVWAADRVLPRATSGAVASRVGVDDRGLGVTVPF